MRRHPSSWVDFGRAWVRLWAALSLHHQALLHKRINKFWFSQKPNLGIKDIRWDDFLKLENGGLNMVIDERGTSLDEEYLWSPTVRLTAMCRDQITLCDKNRLSQSLLISFIKLMRCLNDNNLSITLLTMTFAGIPLMVLDSKIYKASALSKEALADQRCRSKI
ncbi:hypothetical protein OSB04_018700 [Centaurea solstitialis]|uniref:Uncharacterized protein n=1 Tax=Centaurea solstitialis TaxID=347529 RepID=A0AA38T5A7_9ASTR|nr:hypothetical protein OSB04_018700 [Centaurea solstitialis]